MEEQVLDELYALIEEEESQGAGLCDRLLGWLNRASEFNTNLIDLEADWDRDTVTVTSVLDDEVRGQTTPAELRSILTTLQSAHSLREDGETTITAEHADSLRERGVRVADLERLGFEVEPAAYGE